MGLTSIGGVMNLEMDPVLASAAALTATRWTAGKPIEVVRVQCAPISTASGAQCGHVSIRDGTTVIARYYVFWTAAAAGQSSLFDFPIGAIYTPTTSLNVLYTAVTDATTALVSLFWR